MRQLVVFAVPEADGVELRRDNEQLYPGKAGFADGRPAWLVDLPDDGSIEEGWGAWIVIRWGKATLEQHGVLWVKERNGVALPKPEFVSDYFQKPKSF